VVGPSSPSSGCLNGFSQSRNWPVGFDHNAEIVVWEEEEDGYWDGLPLDWAMDGDFGEEAMAIRDAMEEEFQFFGRQKSKGKRELLNLHSSINYGDVKYPSRRRKGKAHMSKVCCALTGSGLFLVGSFYSLFLIFSCSGALVLWVFAG
jgi:hypothetical protein